MLFNFIINFLIDKIKFLPFGKTYYKEEILKRYVKDLYKLRKLWAMSIVIELKDIFFCSILIDVITLCGAFYFDLIRGKRLNIALTFLEKSNGFTSTVTITPFATMINSYDSYVKLVDNSVSEWWEQYMDDDKILMMVYLNIYEPLVDNLNKDVIKDIVKKHDMLTNKRNYSTLSNENLKHFQYITKRGKDRYINKYITADTEAVIIDGEHVVVIAAAYFMCKQNEVDEKRVIFHAIPNKITKEASNTVIFKFIDDVLTYSDKFKIRYMYMHNLNYDGMLLMNALIMDNKYSITPKISDSDIYSIKVSCDNKYIIILDSLRLFTLSLQKVSNIFVPHLKGKLPFNHNLVSKDNYLEMKDEFIKYCIKDCELLYHSLEVFQSRVFTKYGCDITQSLTISSLSIKIYRINFLKIPIFKITDDIDKNIRKSYFGGRVEVYKPHANNVYMYDVNSLYPFMMCKKLPIGKPQYFYDLSNYKLENCFGFLTADIYCPKTIDKPVLPYRLSSKLIFPTGSWSGIYFSEELKRAQEIGYTITIKSGYLWEDKNIGYPFKEFVTQLYNERVIAKNDNDSVTSSIIKLFLNSLYGKMGVRPDNVKSYLVLKSKALSFVKQHKIRNEYEFKNSQYILFNVIEGRDTLNVAIASAITAYARLHMYDYISNSNVVYTDTDSIYTTQPLKSNDICNDTIGKFKFEGFAKESFFLAPKLYAHKISEDNIIIKARGAIKKVVNWDWFKTVYFTPELQNDKKVMISMPFFHIWSKIKIISKTLNFKLSPSLDTKREKILSNMLWVDTKPINIKKYIKPPNNMRPIY